MEKEQQTIRMLELILRELRTGRAMCTKWPQQLLHPVHEKFSPPGARAEYEFRFFIEARD